MVLPVLGTILHPLTGRTVSFLLLLFRLQKTGTQHNLPDIPTDSLIILIAPIPDGRFPECHLHRGMHPASYVEYLIQNHEQIRFLRSVNQGILYRKQDKISIRKRDFRPA